MSAPLRDRFVNQFKLAFYELPEMQQIVERSAELLGMQIAGDAACSLARCSRSTPRIANRLLRAVRDFTQVHNPGSITKESVDTTLRALDIDERGLDATDHAIIRTVVDAFAGGPVGLSTIAAMLAEEEATIEDVYEPYLLQQGLLQRTPKGRAATKRTYEMLGLDVPASIQAQLF
jgi:Holliday junction DNA helicase RuvB